MEKVNAKEYAKNLIEEIKKLNVLGDCDLNIEHKRAKKIALMTVKLIKAQVTFLEEEYFDDVINEINALDGLAYAFGCDFQAPTQADKQRTMNK